MDQWTGYSLHFQRNANPLSVNPAKWSNSNIVGCCQSNRVNNKIKASQEKRTRANFGSSILSQFEICSYCGQTDCIFEEKKFAQSLIHSQVELTELLLRTGTPFLSILQTFELKMTLNLHPEYLMAFEVDRRHQ